MCKAIEELIDERVNRQTIRHVLNIMESLDMSLSKVMDVLELSQEEREYVTSAIKTA